MRYFISILFFCLAVPVMGWSQTHDDPILVDVEVKPTWPGCETLTDEPSRNDCFDKNIASFFSDFIIYPANARKKKTEGEVVVQFVVEKDGSITNILILHDIGNGCGDEVVRAIQHLPTLIPGMDGGMPVRVLYKAPFYFKLN